MKFAKHCMAIVGFTLVTSVHAAPQRVGDFGLLDDDGVFHQLSRYRHRDALVLMSYLPECSDSNRQAATLKELQLKYESLGIGFALIDSLDAGRPVMASQPIDLPILEDDGQLVSETLGFTQSGEIAILDPQRLTLLYRGPNNEAFEQVLQAALAGETGETRIETVSTGCAIEYAAKQQHFAQVPDYATEIAPLIAENCAICHREGGIGPFAMNSHLMIQGWSPMIREVLLTKRMPPEQVDPYIGHFSNARYLSDENLQKIVHWIDSGAPRGSSPVDPLAELSFPDHDDWQLGDPDYIVKAPVQEIPATGVLDYINVDVELPFTEDKWVRAVQYVPGDRSVLHHLLTYVTAPAESFEGGESDTRSVAQRFLEGYAPGKIDAMVFPEETGVLIPAGHKLSMQFHYTTNGRATTDETVLGIYFHDEPPTYENFTRSVVTGFRIPPHAMDHKAHAQYVFDEDVVVTGLRAHMHFRGKDMKFSVEQPDGSLKPILSVPAYSYAWQPTYQLDSPEFIPAGTKVHVTGTFDNSEFNPANPDPNKLVTFGLQSWDEMFIGYWTYHSATPSN